MTNYKQLAFSLLTSETVTTLVRVVTRWVNGI